MSLRFCVRDCSRSISNAACSSIAVALHQDAFGSFGGGAASERAFEFVVFGEAAQDDVDRALPVVDVGVVDVGEHAELGCFFDELRVSGVQ